MNTIFLILLLVLPFSEGASNDVLAELIELKEIPLEHGSNYRITLPSGFRIKKSNGTDYIVYSFSNTKDKSKNRFVGGLYMGNAPYEEQVMNESCPIDSFRNSFLDQQVLWKIHKCNDRLMLQTVYENPSSDLKIHAFGSSKTMAGVVNLYHSFQSLRN